MHALSGYLEFPEDQREATLAALEAIPEADYHRLGYYQRWIRSVADNLLRKGVITETELRAALEGA